MSEKEKSSGSGIDVLEKVKAVFDDDSVVVSLETGLDKILVIACVETGFNGSNVFEAIDAEIGSVLDLQRLTSDGVTPGFKGMVDFTVVG